jgi:hypothetical protein
MPQIPRTIDLPRGLLLGNILDRNYYLKYPVL